MSNNDNSIALGSSMKPIELMQSFRFTLVSVLFGALVWTLSSVVGVDVFQLAIIFLSHLNSFAGSEIMLLLGIVLVGWVLDHLRTKVQVASDRLISEHKIRSEQIIDGAAESIISVDVNHNIIAFNRSAEVAFGYVKKEVIGRPLDLLLPKGAAKKHAEHVRGFGVSSDQARWMGERDELYAVRKNGELFPVEMSASKQNTAAGLTFTAIVNDVSERERMYKALCESEARFRALVNYAPIKLHIKDVEGRYILINRKCEELFCVTNEEAHGKRTSEIFPSDKSSKFDEHDKSVINTGTPVEAEEEFVVEDGVQTYLTVKFPILGVDDNIVAVGSCGFEITERKKAELELIQHRDHLEKMVEDRTVDVTENAVQLENALAREKEFSALQKKFVSLVSHEFRTPLTIIDGAAQRLIRRKDRATPDEVETRAQKVRSSITRMIGLIDTTLFASSLDAGKLELCLMPCDIKDVIREVCERQAEISPSHNIQVDIDSLPSEVVADPRRLDQVFTNLLSNAVKYAPQHPLIVVEGRVDRDHLSVSVTDQGLGIPEGDLQHMFKRYFRAKTAAGVPGTGIGLSVVKEFVGMHNGIITVDSVEGAGSSFTVRLPIVSRTECHG